MSHASRSEGFGKTPEFLVPDITFEEIDAAMSRARRLRAEAVAAGFAGLWRAPARLFTRRAAPHHVRTSLTALRSSAEILRDNPEIDPAQRRRLVDIVLAEEARLERLIGRYDRSERAA
ncbi:hypothetical protein G5B40_08515 [Pikeienuella piscinae]|uniref:histidine kinase n=1 Tax=Pikeienuella piscinae TaxID=2748098 RepID=A0A7L5BYA2_9RHOB|nr:histidine kinase dimerization/phospho-acceptor domain-containing protein [Pikeienuella piscinae]QIE55497.1 hypothetical protein G5B40_08515 [Pikeienuella piscinae]